MQALRIRVPGRYWDSYLYNDVLYLVTRDGDLEEYSWDRLVDTLLPSDASLEQVVRHLATRGKAWYALGTRELIQHTQLGRSLRRLVKTLSAEVLTVQKSDLSSIRRGSSRISTFPTTDIECYANTMFLGSLDGLLLTGLGKASRDTSRGSLLYDGPCQRLQASYRRLAIALGSEGLAEMDVFPWSDAPYGQPFQPSLISHERCDICNWVSFDLVASQIGSGGYLGAFSKPATGGRYVDEERTLIGTVRSEDLFASGGGTLIGGGTLVALITDKEVATETWNPYRRRPDSGVDLDRTRVGFSRESFARGDRILDAALTVFGVVAEFDNALRVRGTDGQSYELGGEPVSWRVFPRSQRYLNHLHVVRDRWIDIYAFAHDYFVPSAEREIGLPRPLASTW